MNTAQKIAVSVSLLLVATFLFAWAYRVREWTHPQIMQLKVITCVAGILAVGGAAIMLLGIKWAVPTKTKPTRPTPKP
jgi:hypothetical protein